MKNGKKCPSCGRVNVQGAFQCGKCGTNLENVQVKQYEANEFEIALTSKPKVQGRETEESSNYKAAKGVASGIEVVGWLLVAVGVIAAVIGAGSASNGGNFLLALLPGLGLSITGLLLVMGAQVTKATIDNADHSREILRVLSAQVEGKKSDK